ncbi:hypothetical protein [Rhodococcus sp. NCIMB 12038]|uniref:hypothetical protein n=1 Tax=Rhodococcus sp. NCIMB 12038 TaxID=933800 RepID=UPI000B3CBF52|nr:hypothetical protein [Rhodococcus sp. NCIMB 12038]OUS94060.1 hypothetical protein CA951_19470 [Rhodococcus sp. NCIMB 12038]
MALTALDRRLLGWSAAFVISQANIIRLLGPVAPRLAEIQTARSARDYTAILDGMTASDTARYRSHYYPDFVHPLIYAVALRTGARRLAELTPLSPRTQRVLAVAPVISAAGDYAENVVGLHLLSHREHITDATVRTTSAVSVTKWVLALGALGYLSRGFVRVWAGKLFSR